MGPSFSLVADAMFQYQYIHVQGYVVLVVIFNWKNNIFYINDRHNVFFVINVTSYHNNLVNNRYLVMYKSVKFNPEAS